MLRLIFLNNGRQITPFDSLLCEVLDVFEVKVVDRSALLFIVQRETLVINGWGMLYKGIVNSLIEFKLRCHLFKL
jgi:hypothetical protein